MAYGILIESKIQAKNIEALNRSAIATVDVAGGGLVSLVAPTTQGEDRWTANTPSAGNLKVAIAYNPAVQYNTVNGISIAGYLVDPRAYTNLANKTFDVFLPKVGDEIVITVDAVDASASSIVAGDFLEPKASQTTFQRIASGTGSTNGSTSFKVEYVGALTFPNAGIGNDSVTVYKAVCVQE